MGEFLGRLDKETDSALQRAESNLARLTQSKAFEATQSAADIAGIVDPTPASDLVGLGLAVAKGDWPGALLSSVSFIPYLGDAVAKPIKAARSLKAIKALDEALGAAAKRVSTLKSVAHRFAQRKKAAAAERARRAKIAGEAWEAAKKKCKCLKPQTPTNRFGTQVPTEGKWSNPNDPGHGQWTSSDGRVSVQYKEGYPDFTTSKPKSLHADGGGMVEIEMKGDKSDGKAARDAMRQRLGDPKWPGNNFDAPNGYTWHHAEDGTTMQLLDKNVHDKAISDAAHSGGASIVSGVYPKGQKSQF